MDIIETIILGIVQGIGEFLPISSSAHLIIFRDIFGIGSHLVGDMELSFDIALHFGTLLAILVYFFKDFFRMIIKGFTKGFRDNDGKMLWYVVIATIPAAICGVLFEDIIDSIIRGNYIVIVLALSIMGIIIYLSDRLSSDTKDFRKMTLKDAFIIGCSQILALIPGFSRSGTTISMARILKINRSDAAKFSFYLSAPIVFGACFVSFLKGDMISLISSDITSFIIGVSVSFVTGLLCIKFLMNYIKKHDYKIFMWYRLLIALIVVIFLILK